MTKILKWGAAVSVVKDQKTKHNSIDKTTIWIIKELTTKMNPFFRKFPKMIIKKFKFTQQGLDRGARKRFKANNHKTDSLTPNYL